jgi:hypothetical protein
MTNCLFVISFLLKGDECKNMNLIDLTGKVFGNLTVIGRAENKISAGQAKTQWRCLCSCENYYIASAEGLREGTCTHCGCKDGHIIDLTGERFGRLLVIKIAHRPGRRGSSWLCKCDCGKDVVVASKNLRNGSTKSCGCLQKDIIRDIGKINKGIKRPDQSVGEGRAALNALFGKYKRVAVSRNLVFNLDIEEFEFLTSQSCYYCGCEPQQIFHRAAFCGDYIYNGIDRVDNNTGYVSENVVPCCGLCNKTKFCMTKDEFLSWVDKVYFHIHKLDENGEKVANSIGL